MSKRTLLLADDSITIQKVVNLTFADEGIEVITVGDGDSAMDKVAELSPDVVLADVHMPGLSGYQICEMMRDNPATKDIPVVLLVGSFEPFDENEAARVGARAYLTKPFQSIRQLVSQVTDLMEASAATATAPATEDAPQFASNPVEVPDTNDIDSLYHQSFGEPEAESDSDRPRFVDAGMDDEMIETTHAEADLQEEAHAFAAPATEDYQGEGSYSGYQAATSEQPVEEHRGEQLYSGYQETASEATAGDHRGEEFYSGYNESTTPASSPFDSTADDNYGAVPTAVFESEPEPAIDQFAATAQIPQIDTLTTDESFQLDDIELLELPPIESGNTLEFTTSQALAAEGSGQQVVSLSPELIEIIVEKVVARLSEKN